MANLFDMNSDIVSNMGDTTYVTVAGYVRAPNGAAIRRHIEVFNNNDMREPIGRTESNAEFGFFSVEVVGLPYTQFTVVAKGRHDENDVIYAHCTE